MGDRAGNVPIEPQTGRVQPDRRWFGNTRVVNPTELDRFRQKITERAADPYSIVLRQRKLPMGLLQEDKKVFLFMFICSCKMAYYPPWVWSQRLTRDGARLSYWNDPL